jgi:AcrR family transcriptional regulator
MSRPKPSGPRAVGTHFDGDLRRALIDSAVVAIVEVGVEQVSLRDVARRIGVSHAAPAHHFGDKAGLFTCIATEGFQLFVTRLGAVPTGRPRRTIDRLAELGRVYADFAERFPAHFDLMFRPAVLRVDDADFARAGTAAFDALRQHIEACQRAGWRAQADTGALVVSAWALAHGLAVLRSTGSLARNYQDPSLDGVVALVRALLDAAEE